VISNLKTKIYSSPQTHPINYLLEKQLKVTVNSDDPAMFGATITDEFLHLYKKLDVSHKEIKRLTLNALDSSFTSKEKKSELKNVIEMFWKRHNV
jgi:adenosine deaminase